MTPQLLKQQCSIQSLCYVQAVGFPGEIMLRLLKMLVLPLVAGSMIAGKPNTFIL